MGVPHTLILKYHSNTPCMKQVQSRTKIVATMGPASSQKEMLISMIEAGLNVCRLNFSHGSQEVHQKTIDTIREINAAYKINVGILADLQGPKIRIGMVQEGGIQLVNGAQITITTTEQIGDNEKNIHYLRYFPERCTPRRNYFIR